MINETHRAAAIPSRDEHRSICPSCGRGRLDLIDEWPHPIVGVAGVTRQMLKSDAPECGKLTII
jgi:hypothetical protein